MTKGSRYKGQYIDGLRHGLGVYRFYIGDIYAGECLNKYSLLCSNAQNHAHLRTGRLTRVDSNFGIALNISKIFH